MNKAVYYKYMFIVAGVFNIFSTMILGVLTLALGNQFLNLFGLTKPATYLWMSVALMLLAVFGFNFFLVGLDIRKNHLVVSSGIISKIVFMGLLITFYILKNVTWPTMIFVGIDLIFVILFIEFFVNYKKLDAIHIAQAYAPMKKPDS